MYCYTDSPPKRVIAFENMTARLFLDIISIAQNIKTMQYLYLWITQNKKSTSAFLLIKQKRCCAAIFLDTTFRKVLSSKANQSGGVSRIYHFLPKMQRL